MKRVFQFIAVFIVGFLTCSYLERIRLAMAEASFHEKRSNCGKILMGYWQQWEQNEGKVDLGVVNGKHYISVDWSKRPEYFEQLSCERPLVYDRYMSNHVWRGINILMTDGTIKWDANAEWLKKFKAEHPDANLPMPE